MNNKNASWSADTQKDASWAADTQKARAQALEPFDAYLSRNAEQATEAMVLAIKGKRGHAEEAEGTPLSGRDGAALASAFERLEWNERDWCGAVLSPREAPLLTGECLRLFIEVLDPMIVVTLDEEARKEVIQALGREAERADGLRKTIEIQGRLLVNVDGFEAALDSEIDKQHVWQQLKQASRAEVLKRFK